MLTKTVYKYTLLRVTNHLDEFINVALVVVDPETKKHGFVIHKNIKRALILVDLDIMQLASCISFELNSIHDYINGDITHSFDPDNPVSWTGAQSMFQYRSYFPVMADDVQDAINKLAKTFDMDTN